MLSCVFDLLLDWTELLFIEKFFFFKSFVIENMTWQSPPRHLPFGVVSLPALSIWIMLASQDKCGRILNF